MRQFLRSFNDVLRLIRRGPTSQDTIKVCPVCLTNSLEMTPNPFLGFLSPPYYKCRECEYKGPIFAEIKQSDYEKLDSFIETNLQVGQDDNV